MSSDPFKAFGDAAFGALGGLGSGMSAAERLSLTTLRAKVAEAQAAHEATKRKARGLIDVAYNRALADMVAELLDSPTAQAAAKRLRRKVRDA